MEKDILRQQGSEFEISMMLQYLAPWADKCDEENTLGNWEEKLPTKMMMKLLGLWLTEESRNRVASMMAYYHPLDRAAMAYALVVYVMTGKKMILKNGAANQHYKIICKLLKEDMATLMFAGHMKYMIRRYGPKAKKA